MSEDFLQRTKQAVLNHVDSIFQEIEESMVMKHQEKYLLLEDVFENANDVDELRIAFEQWYIDHADDLELDDSVDELWGIATSSMYDEDE